MNMDYPSRSDDQPMNQNNPRKPLDIVDVLKQCGIDPKKWQSLVSPQDR